MTSKAMRAVMFSPDGKPSMKNVARQAERLRLRGAARGVEVYDDGEGPWFEHDIFPKGLDLKLCRGSVYFLKEGMKSIAAKEMRSLYEVIVPRVEKQDEDFEEEEEEDEEDDEPVADEVDDDVEDDEEGEDEDEEVCAVQQDEVLGNNEEEEEDNGDDVKG